MTREPFSIELARGEINKGLFYVYDADKKPLWYGDGKTYEDAEREIANWRRRNGICQPDPTMTEVSR